MTYYTSEALLPMEKRGSNMVRFFPNRRSALAGHMIAAGIGAVLALALIAMGALA